MYNIKGKEGISGILLLIVKRSATQRWLVNYKLSTKGESNTDPGGKNERSEHPTFWCWLKVTKNNVFTLILHLFFLVREGEGNHFPFSNSWVVLLHTVKKTCNPFCSNQHKKFICTTFFALLQINSCHRTTLSTNTTALTQQYYKSLLFMDGRSVKICIKWKQVSRCYQM